MGEVFFNGPEGRIEGRMHNSEDPDAPSVLLLPPDPRHGGTMNNTVVYNAFRSFADQGMTVLRINYRGVGRSEGKFDNGLGELADSATALDWLQTNNISSQFFWVCGFSFGSWLAMQLLMRRPEISGFIAISPPVNKFDFNFLSPCPAPGMFIHGTNDSITKESAVNSLYDRLTKQSSHEILYEIVNGADHFYRSKLDELQEIITSYVVNRLDSDIDTDYLMRPTKKRRKPNTV
ncbi:MAG: alpha/beta hydrolase [Pseudomonadota bacterium]